MDALLRRRLMMQAGGGPTPPPTPTPVFYDKLIFDGACTIQTDIVLPANCSMRVTLGSETLKAAQGVFGAWDGTGGIGLFYGGATSSTRRQLVNFYDSASLIVSNLYLDFTYTTFGFYMTPKRIGFGGYTQSFTKGSHHPTGALYLGDWSANTADYTGEMRTYYIYNSDAQNVASYSGFESYTPAYTLRPCTYNGEAGMWCVETGTFYGKTSGAGTLTVANL